MRILRVGVDFKYTHRLARTIIAVRTCTPPVEQLATVVCQVGGPAGGGDRVGDRRKLRQRWNGRGRRLPVLLLIVNSGVVAAAGIGSSSSSSSSGTRGIFVPVRADVG